MKFDPDCPCKHCKHIRYKNYMQSLYNSGYTWSWTDTGETKTRKPWWSWREYEYKKQVRISLPPDFYIPITVHRWRRVKR